MAEKQYVWITTVFHDTDVPNTWRCELVRRLKNGVVVRLYGGEGTIRNAAERHMFFDETSWREFCRRHLERRRDCHRGAVEKIEKALRDGLTAWDRPAEAPPKLTKEQLEP